MIRRAAFLVFCALAALLLGAGTAAAAGPQWKLTVYPNAEYFVPGPEDTQAVYNVEAENVGDAETSNSTPIAIEDHLPSGLVPTEVRLFESEAGFFNSLARFGLCSVSSVVKCKYPGSLSNPFTVKPGKKLVLQIGVEVPAGLPEGQIFDRAKVSGGGAASAAEAGVENTVSASPLFSLPNFFMRAADSSKAPYTQAGGHPFQLATEINFATNPELSPPRALDQNPAFALHDNAVPVHDPRDLPVALPPGLIANQQAVPRCALVEFFNRECSAKTIVGTVGVLFGGWSTAGFNEMRPVFNVQPAGPFVGQLAYEIHAIPFLVTAGVRTGSDYAVVAGSFGAPQAGLQRARLTLWGVPAEPSHDDLRGKLCEGTPVTLVWGVEFAHSVEEDEHDCEIFPTPFGQVPNGGPAEVPPTPYLTMPTECSGEELPASVRARSWQEPENWVEARTSLPAVDGCNQLSFQPSIEARPTTTLADAPSGLEFDLHVPQNGEPEGVATPDLHEAVVKLPAGMVVNPASGNGLGACSPAAVGLTTPVGQVPAHFSEEPARCPEQSTIGTVEVNTPLLHEPLTGSVFLASPRQNPFSSFLAAYVVLEGQGLIIKLPGRIEADPQTGQLTGRFVENPETPFEDFHLNFFGGARGDLRTPAVCGSYETTSVLTPYSAPESGPPAEPSSRFALDNGGAACPRQDSEEPNAPVFRAGTESPQAGAFSPFVLRLARVDGSQEFERIETTMPPGLTAKLAGVAECSDAQIALAKSREQEGGGAEELASPACPAASQVGEVQVASGAGPTPLNVSGKAYLAGPYKGAPLSLEIITPAVAGPFDLGDVAVRTALYVDPETTRVKAVSDPIPHILQGIPLDVRSITLKMNRPNFTLNPTNCEELGFTGAETSLLGSVAPLTQRFQVGGCRTLPFKPKLSISLKGSTRRSGTPALKAVLKMPPGNANVASAQVTLPHSEFLDQSHLQNICTRVQFSEHACPATSVYGHAVASTPLLDHPLEGPVYLRSSSHLLPDLAVDLEGQINVVLDSKVDSVHESLRNTFEMVPDAPVSKFVLTMKGGKHSLIENSTDVCLHRQRATGLFRGQNGKTLEVNPLLRIHCKAKGRHNKRGKKRHRDG